MKDYPWGKGTPTWTRDATLNDSDKSFTVPAGKLWHMKLVHAGLTATATVGTRLLQMRIAADGTNSLGIFGQVSVTASQSGAVNYGFNSVFDDAVVAQVGYNNMQNIGCSEVILTAGAVIRVYDQAAIDAAADDMTVVLHYVEYDA